MKDNLQTLAEKTLQIEEESVRTRIPVKYLSEVITTRVKEIIDAILYEIQMSGFADQLRSGVVVTGAGRTCSTARTISRNCPATTCQSASREICSPTKDARRSRILPPLHQ